MSESLTTVAAVLQDAVTLEKQLADAKVRTAKALREAREARGYSLRAIAKAARLSPSALSDLERGETWQSKTAARVLRSIERQDRRGGPTAAAAGDPAPAVKAA